MTPNTRLQSSDQASDNKSYPPCPLVTQEVFDEALGKIYSIINDLSVVVSTLAALIDLIVKHPPSSTAQPPEPTLLGVNGCPWSWYE